MADNSYNVEIKLASSNGWHTPAQARAYYGRYDRSGYCVHWWGDGTGAANHDNIVNYMNAQAAAGNKSVNYVVSDNKITLCVSPDNVAWCQESGNATEISVEHQPTLGAEGYKKSGWLLDQLEQRYGRTLVVHGHNYWFQTACPGTIDLNRIRAEADKWKSGYYDSPSPVPVPPPTPLPTPTPPPTITLQITDIPNKQVRLIRDANLWDLHFVKYPDAKVIKTLPAGTQIEASAIAKHPLGSQYYLSEYSFVKGVGNGININDCEDIGAPPVDPPKPPEPTPVPIPILTTEERLTKLEKLVQAIVDFIKNLGFKG